MSKIINLDIEERFSIPFALPGSGGKEMKHRKSIGDKLSITDAERESWQVRDMPNGGMQWNVKTDQTRKDIKFSDEEIQMIQESLNAKIEENALPHQLWTSYEKFVLAFEK